MFLGELDQSRPFSKDELTPYTIVESKPARRRVGWKLASNNQDTFDGLLFTTKGKGTWFVIPPAPRNMLVARRNVPYLNGAGEALKSRQRFNQSNSNEQGHRDNLLLLAALPNDIFQEIYYGKRYTREPNRIRPLVEVDFNDLLIKRTTRRSYKEEVCGKADQIDVGPDGQIIMTEVGSSGLQRKSLQVTRHSLGTEFVVNGANHGKVPPITRFVALYERPDPLEPFTVMRIYPAVSDRVKEYRRAVVEPIQPKEIFNAERHKRRIAYN